MTALRGKVYQSPAKGPRTIDDWDFANEPTKPLCPTIVGSASIVIPPSLTKLVRGAPKPPSLQSSLIRVPATDDIWTTYNQVEAHTDNTWTGKVTYGLVIVNDAERRLFWRDKAWEIPPGTLYRLDGRIVHGTCDGAPYGLFAALVWDIPWTDRWTLIDFGFELLTDKRIKP